MRHLLLLAAVTAAVCAQPASAKRHPTPRTVTIRAVDINRDPMTVTRSLRARGLRVRAFVVPATADAVGTVVDVRSQRVIECACNSSPHDPYDEAAAHRDELDRLRSVVLGRDWVRIPADYPYDLQVFVGRAAWGDFGPRYDTHGPLPVHGPGITFTPWSPIGALRGQ